MTLPLTLPLKLTDLHAEFEAPDGTPLSAFVRDGTYVPSNSDNVNVPTALPLAITDFFGASQTIPTILTIPQDPANLLGVLHNLGVGATNTHVSTDPVIATNDKWVIEATVRCGAGFQDGSDESPQLPGYSWARERMRIVFGAGSDWNDFAGVSLDFYFTSATSGYLRCGVMRPASIGNTVSDQQYQDQPNTEYGNLVLPDENGLVKIKVTRGESITSYQSGRYALDYRVYIYVRDEWVELWKDFDQRIGGTLHNPYNDGGTLVVGNNVYNNGAECDLEFFALDALIGDTVLP